MPATAKPRDAVTATTAGAPREPLASPAGRGRTTRGRNTDGLPPFSLPEHFINDHVLLYEAKSLGRGLEGGWFLDEVSGRESKPYVVASLDEVKWADIQDYWGGILEGASWNSQRLADAVVALGDGDVGPLERRVEAITSAAAYLTAALAYGGSSHAPSVLGLENLDPSRKLGRQPLPLDPESKKILADEGRKAPALPDKEAAGHQGFDSDELWKSASAELCSRLRAELRTTPPKTRAAWDVKRPVSVLATMNFESRTLVHTLVEDASRALGADVIHLDASCLGEIVGGFLGQTPFWGRGDIAMLGYAVAAKNGRMAARYPQDEEETDISTGMPPLRVELARLPFAAKLLGKYAPVDLGDRWDDLKVGHALEAMVRAAETKRESAALPTAGPLVVHIHDYVELSMTSPGLQLLNKLRGIVDRLWLNGRPIAVVGSTSATRRGERPDFREKLEELGQTDCHFFPVRLTRGSETAEVEQRDIMLENVNHIRTMVTALVGRPVSIGKDQAKWGGTIESFLSRTVYDVDWVYRLATHVMDYRGPGEKALDERALLHAFESVQARDKQWESTDGAKAPYFSPLSNAWPSAPGSQASSDPAQTSRGTRPRDTSDLDDFEKQLRSGLIDAKDIHTTFDSVVCPPESKASIRALTSLSLTRPEAFLYGILATERLPGCLLYGPPGTGKTMLAKAVAKESGASMLEISAATINDKWVGNSEKKVQALFSLAKKMAPTVIFIDEADAILGARQAKSLRGGSRETINQFLREWDGVTDTKAFIMVATNRPFDLDDAVLRRLPRKILLDLPLGDARLQILRVLLRDEVLAESVSLGALAARTELYSGSDLKHLCVAAAMEAVKEELRGRDAHAGSEPYSFPDKRVLATRHFEAALGEIGPSISEDMATLQAIRKFDERYGDGRRRNRRRHMGFDVVPGGTLSREALVRQASPA